MSSSKMSQILLKRGCEFCNSINLVEFASSKGQTVAFVQGLVSSGWDLNDATRRGPRILPDTQQARSDLWYE